jgi:hypothetical protein
VVKDENWELGGGNRALRAETEYEDEDEEEDHDENQAAWIWFR